MKYVIAGVAVLSAVAAGAAYYFMNGNEAAKEAPEAAPEEATESAPETNI